MNIIQQCIRYTGSKMMMEQLGVEPSGFFGGRIYEDYIARYSFARSFVRNATVLDIACGTGKGTSILSATANDVVGVDIAAAAIRKAKRTYTSKKICFVHSDAFAYLKKTKETYDVVVSFDTLEHIRDYTQFLRLLFLSVTPGGILLISTPNRSISELVAGCVFNPYHVHEFYMEEFINLIASVCKRKIDVYVQRPLRRDALWLSMGKEFMMRRTSRITECDNTHTGMDVVCVVHK